MGGRRTGGGGEEEGRWGEVGGGREERGGMWGIRMNVVPFHAWSQHPRIISYGLPILVACALHCPVGVCCCAYTVCLKLQPFLQVSALYEFVCEALNCANVTDGAWVSVSPGVLFGRSGAPSTSEDSLDQDSASADDPFEDSSPGADDSEGSPANATSAGEPEVATRTTTPVSHFQHNTISEQREFVLLAHRSSRAATATAALVDILPHTLKTVLAKHCLLSGLQIR